MTHPRSFARRFIRRWESIQVELNGFYSVERFAALNEFSRSTSPWRAVATLFLTPLPSLVLVALIDAMPLEDPGKGFARSGTLWVRGVITCFIYTHCAIEQIRLYSPNLELTALAGLCISIPSALLTNALGVLLSALICYPLPFASILLSGPWLGFMTFFLLRLRGAHMRANPEAVKDVVRFATICGTQVTIVMLYAVYNTIFTKMPPTYQPLFALFLPVFKIMQKNVLSRILAGRHDTKPQVVILNVEIFNALFIASCMQNSQSIGTSITLIVVDLLQAVVSLIDLRRMMNDVKKIMDKLGVSTTALIATAELVLEKYPTTALRRSSTNVKLSQLWSKGSSHAVAKQVLPTMNMDAEEYQIPIPKSQLLAVKAVSQGSVSYAESDSTRNLGVSPATGPSTGIDSLTSQEHYRLLKKALQVLFLTEFMLLIEFTEVLVPVIYGKLEAAKADRDTTNQCPCCYQAGTC
jgi:hypothetical protein